MEDPGPPEVRNYIQENSTLLNGKKPDLRTAVTISTSPDENLGTVTSSRGDTVDNINPSNAVTDGNGHFHTTLKTRENIPSLKLTVAKVQSQDHLMVPALYKNNFHITGYSTPSENDSRFTGSLVTTTTLTTGRGTPNERKYTITSPVSAKSDFLQSLAVEGEGYFSNNTHAIASNHTIPGTSHPIETTTNITTDNNNPKATNNRDLVQDESCAITRNAKGDGLVIPDASNLKILTQSGNWSAIDRVSTTESGGNYHIDLYKGFDRAAADLISEDAKVILVNY